MSSDPYAQSLAPAVHRRWGDPEFEAAVAAATSAQMAQLADRKRPSRALPLFLAATTLGGLFVAGSSWRGEKSARDALEARSVATVEAQMALGREVEARAKSEQTLKAKSDAYERRIAELEAQVAALKAAGYVDRAAAPAAPPAAAAAPKVRRAAEKRQVGDDPLAGIQNVGGTDGRSVAKKRR
jgi:hypothetical protein